VLCLGRGLRGLCSAHADAIMLTLTLLLSLSDMRTGDMRVTLQDRVLSNIQRGDDWDSTVQEIPRLGAGTASTRACMRSFARVAETLERIAGHTERARYGNRG
jgi:hypothetical protein